MAKSKLFDAASTKLVKAKLGASTSSAKNPPNPLVPPKKDYSKAQQREIGSNANFGQTGLTGES